MGEGNTVAYVLRGTVLKMQRTEWFLGSSLIVFSNVSRMSMLTLDMILILNAKATGWMLCLCTHFQPTVALCSKRCDAFAEAVGNSKAPRSKFLLFKLCFLQREGWSVCVSVQESL